MKRFNLDDTDQLALQIVRADMARIHGEPMQKPAQPTATDTSATDDTWVRLPMFLRRQAE